MSVKKNKIVDDFGNEWEKFDQIKLDQSELLKIYNDYFDIFLFLKIKKTSFGIDLGCGSGRWSKFSARKVKNLTLLDASYKSIETAKKLLINEANIEYIVGDITSIPVDSNKYDFAYSLGVLHHVPKINKALGEIYRILKPGSPFLLYLYYSLENEPRWYQNIWKMTNFLRRVISNKKISFLKMLICEVIALTIYFPLAKVCLLLEKYKINISNIPLSYYRNKSFYTMRTDSLDRFGTTYEKRYSKNEINEILTNSGFKSIEFSSTKPFWCILCYK